MNRFAVIVLSVWAGLTAALSAQCQSITTIVSFNGTNGAAPEAGSGLTLGRDGNFYGTTYGGGSGGAGTVFKVTTNGTLTTLVNFNGTNGSSPGAGLTLGPDGIFYGTTLYGGSGGPGTVFKVTTNGTLTTLVSFNFVGDRPAAGLTLGRDGNYYGATYSSSTTNFGSVFKVTTNGMLTTLFSFNGTNGKSPVARLTLGPDGNFYGTTEYGGGGFGFGTVFKVTTDGMLTTLVNFNDNNIDGTNGAYLDTSLTWGPDGNLYGTTENGGSSGRGTMFKMTTNGIWTMLLNFNATNGTVPSSSLTLGPDGNFYGTTLYGGSTNDGEVFRITTNGTLTTLASFNGTNGSNAESSLTLGPDGNFYGLTAGGGSAGHGTIFRLELPPDFITSPSTETAIIGSSATFNGQVFGTSPFAYQWLSNGVPIIGATNATLSFSPALTNAMADYQLVVTNTYGSITSQVASLNVLLQPNVYSVSNSGAGNFTVYSASLPNTTNRLWMSTNVSLDQWQVIATNVTDSNGLAQFFDTNTTGMPQKFYRLSYP